MKPYSLDLRNRMFSFSLTHSVRRTAEVFHVSPNTVHLLQKRFIETGQLAPKPRRAGRPRVVSGEGELFLCVLLREQVDLTLEELRERYAAAFGVSVSLGAMHGTLKRLGLTLKKSPPTTPKRIPSESRPRPSAITGKSTAFPSTTGSISTRPESG
jgi:transposase